MAADPPRPPRGLIRARETWRLALIMAGAVALLSLIAMGLQYRLVSMRLLAAQETLLRSDLASLGALYEQRRIIALRQAIEFRASASPADELVLLRGRDGQILAGTAADWPQGVSESAQGFAPDPLQRLDLEGVPWLLASRQLPGGFELMAGRSLAPAEETLQVLRRFMLALLGALLLAGAAVGWFAASRVMGRIGRINALADEVASGALQARLPGPRSEDEFGLLEAHVHHMLDRIEILNAATHRLSDTIAHEMRTPLNRILTKLSAIEGQEGRIAALRAEMRNAIRVFDALLDISRAEADQGSSGGLVPLDLSELALGMHELYEPLAEEKGLIAGHDIAPGLRILGDRTLLSQLIANLYDNAIKYCGPGDRLQLLLSQEGEMVRLLLSDSGPGLPEGLGDRVFDRFTRAERDRARGIKGHGLGLALVRAIALRHGARLTLPAAEKGLSIALDFPAAPG